ncbi:MAG: hypothetical protein Q3983_02605 [Capnocytophaga sp.]|nr:hypothetical protein [Capnocytophaga sp.]
MSVLILLISIQQTLIVVHFSLNQDFIEELYCVNKKNVEMNCHGKCQLKKDIQSSSEAATKIINLKDIDIILVAPICFEVSEMMQLEPKPAKTLYHEQLFAHKIVQEQMRPPIV